MRQEVVLIFQAIILVLRGLIVKSEQKGVTVKILIVDDVQLNREILKDRLAQLSVDFIEAGSGKVALSMVEDDRPDLILLDILMPEMDGFEVCRILKDNPATWNIPIIFLSALNDTSEKIKAFELGAADYICKPFNGSEVMARVKTHLRLSGMFQDMNQLLKHSFHEINTPLSVMKTSLELQIMEDGSTQHLEDMKAALLSLQSIYEDMYYSMQKEVLEYKVQWIELEPFFLDRIKYFKPLMREKSITCVIKSNVDSPMMHISAVEAKRLFDNLLSNAIKYADSESEIQISINQNKGDNEIIISNVNTTVKDTSKFFTELYRENHSVLGFGIGLGIVKMICNAYQINIKVKSEESRVNIYLTYRENP